jgi:hypothetical protein
MFVHGNFHQNEGCVAIYHRPENTPHPHICFLVIGHILEFLVETIFGQKFVGVSLQYY